MFTQRGNLRRHIDIHTDNRRYKCELCEKAFTDPKSLTSHMVTHTVSNFFQSKYFFFL